MALAATGRGARRPPGRTRRPAARDRPADPVGEVERLLETGSGTGEPIHVAISGLEQEYGVFLDGRQVDFGHLIDRIVPRDAVRCFAFDECARFVRSGAVWTVDAPHAEIATSPRTVRRGIAGVLADDALYEREALLRRLRLAAGGRGRADLRGYSTHINALARGVDGWRLAGMIASTYSPAIMLLADRRGSPGLLVRPRPSRLEIGTEYLETRDDIVAASLFALAAVIRAWRACLGEDPGMPAPLATGRIRPTWQRPGWFVPRDAFGDDLYALGRSARLRRADGRIELAGTRLATTWDDLRQVAAEIAAPEELTLVDDLVAGRTPLPVERSAPQDPPVLRRHRLPAVEPGPHARVLTPRARRRLEIEPAIASWDQSILQVRHPQRTFFVAIPRDASDLFLTLWADGRLDGPLDAYALGAPAGRIARLDIVEAGLFDAIEPPALALGRLEPAKRKAPGTSRRPPKRAALRPPMVATRSAPRPVVVPPPALPPAPPLVPAPTPPRSWRTPTTWTTIVITVIVIVGLTTVVIGRIPGGGQPPGAPGGTPGSSPPASFCGPNEACRTPLAGSCGPNEQCQTPPGTSAAPTQPIPPPTQPGQPTGAGATPPPQPPTRPGSTPGATPGPTRPPRSGPPTTAPPPVPTASAPTQPHAPPDQAGPEIGQPTWAPGTIGVPFPQLASCSPGSGIDQSVEVTVAVNDPSGVASVTLKYQRAGDAAPRSVDMSLVGGEFRVVLSTADSPATWYPSDGTVSYVVLLGVEAADGAGNTSTRALAPGFVVRFCQ